MISAQILADSKNPQGTRLTTWILKYPRFIHAEFMTHRDFSRNAASSRAIPFKHMLKDVMENPALPVFWAAEHKGMQANEEISKMPVEVKERWLRSKEACEFQADILSSIGLAKSLCNRLLEPWSHITVIATATDHRNFFALRAHPAAMPEFQVLAYRMLELYQSNQPLQKKEGEWHIPFADSMPEGLAITDQIKLATARCCWVSYNKPDKVIGATATPLFDALKRHDESAEAGHWSPFEHCAKAISNDDDYYVCDYRVSNFDTKGSSGWAQYRKMFKQERKTEVDLDLILANRPEWTIEAGL